MKVFQIGLNGWNNPDNESEFDETKVVWVAAESPTIIEIALKGNLDNINHWEEINALPEMEAGVDYFLPQDLEKLLLHISNKACFYE